MKRILFITCLMCNMALGIAQTNYYTQTKTFNENGYTYQCDLYKEGVRVTLYNKNNKWTYIKQMKKGTDKPFYVTSDDYVPLHVIDKNYIHNDSVFQATINKAFANYKMEGWELTIVTCTDSDTGKISEVYFKFTNVSICATIPVSVYRQIETQLVGLQYTLTPLAKSLNYVFQWWPVKPE